MNIQHSLVCFLINTINTIWGLLSFLSADKCAKADFGIFRFDLILVPPVVKMIPFFYSLKLAFFVFFLNRKLKK